MSQLDFLIFFIHYTFKNQNKFFGQTSSKKLSFVEIQRNIFKTSLWSEGYTQDSKTNSLSKHDITINNGKLIRQRFHNGKEHDCGTWFSTIIY